MKHCPSISILRLYKQTTRILGLQTATQVPWFSKAIKKAKENLIKENLIKETLIKEIPVSREPVSREPVSREPVSIHQFIDELLEYKNTLEYIKNRIDKIDNNITSFRSLLQNILGDLANYEVKEEIENTPIENKKIRLPKIAVIGPLKDQYNEISKRVGDGKAILYWVDKETSVGQHYMKGFDYIFISRHCRHHIYWDAKAAIGNEKVFRVPGGIESVANKINEIIIKDLI